VGGEADHTGQGVTGRTLGILGLGNIGLEVATLARPLGLSVVGHDPWADPAARRPPGALRWRNCSAGPTISASAAP
jgi:D-3-phosphoglycerate dehydrogenase